MLGIRRKGEIDYLNTLILAAENAMKAAQLFRNALMSGNPPATYMHEIKELEDMGDKYTHQLFRALNLKQTPPIEREDITELAVRLDDVVDGIEASIARFDYLNITFSDPFMIQFSEVLVSSCEHIVHSFKLLSRKKYMQIREHVVIINELENEADRIMRESIRKIFENPKDPYHDFKLKELYERIEETTDACEDVADIFESIIMRYAE